MKENKRNVKFRQGHKLKSSSITLPEVHGIDKGIDPNIRPENQVIKPMTSEAKGISQVKPKLGQGRAGKSEKQLNFLCPHHLINPKNHSYYQVEGPSFNIAERQILQQPQNIIQPKTK